MSTRPLLRLAAGLAATTSLAILVLGVPAGLVYWQHNPLPHTLPSVSDLGHPMTLDAIARCVAVLLWIAWVQFALAVATEVRYQWPRRHQAQTTGQRGHGSHLRLTGPSGSLAGRLVSLALLLTTASAAILPSASAATAAHVSAAPTRTHTVATAPARPTAQHTARADADSTSTESDTSGASSVAGIPVGARYYTVVQTDSLWRIAEECLGDGSRYGEIYQLNHGRTQPDGRALTERSLIQPGWHLIVPADAAGCPLATAHPSTQARATTYTVAGGNSLTGIADAEYHDPADWPVIYDANRATIHNPDLIYPGQVLEIPALPGQATTPSAAARPEGPATGSSAAATKTGANPKNTSSSGGAAHAGGRPSTAATASPSPSGSTSSPAAGAAATGGAVQSPASANPTHAPAHTGVAAAEVSGQRTIWELLGIGGLAAAAAVTALDLRRRRQQRARREGEYIKLPGGGPRPTTFETVLRCGDDAQSGAWMGQVLRAAAAGAAAAGVELPELRIVSLGPDALYIQPAQPCTPVAPFTANEDWWVCPRTAALPSADSLSDVPTPYPALVTVGCDEQGRAILLDLESIRSLAVPGPAGLGALRAMALELAGQISADLLTLTLVGVGAELASAELPASLNLAIDLDAAIDALEDGVAAAADQLVSCGRASVRAARLAADAEAPVTHVVISAEEPTAEQSQRLARILESAPAMCAAVTTGTPIPIAGPAWVLPATGTREPLEPTGIPVQAQFLTDSAYEELLEHFRVSADLDSTPDPGWTAPSTEPDPHAVEVESDGTWEELADAFEIEPSEEPLEGVDDGDVTAPTAIADLEARLIVPSASPGGARGASLAPFPLATTLDRAPHPAPPAPRLLLLGPVQLVGTRGSVESSRAPRLRELAAFIMLHPNTGSTELIEAVWPGGTSQRNKDTSANKLRAWLGRDDGGEAFFPKAYGGYRLASGVQCDLLEFNAHYQAGIRARAEGATQEAAARFEAGLALVRGRPFAGAEPKRYGWAEPVLQQTVSEIVDSVRHLARIRMAEQDWMAAATIAAWGMGIGPEHECLFRLRFEAVYRMGDQIELGRLSTTLQAKLEDVGMSMEYETQELLEELLDSRYVLHRP